MADDEKKISDRFTKELLSDAICLNGEDGKTRKENIKPKAEEETPSPNGAGSWPY